MLAWLWQRLSNGGPGITVSGRALRRFADPEVDRLLRSRVLIEQPKTDIWPVCVHCECGLDARPIREVHGQLRACCPYDPAEDEALEPDDLRRFRIDADRVANAIAATSTLEPDGSQICDGLWRLGRTSTGRFVMLCFDVHVFLAPGVILAAKAAAGSTSITVIANAIDLASELRLQETGIEARSLSDCVSVDEHGRECLNFEHTSPMPSNPRLRLSRDHQSAWLDGRRLDLPPQMFALLRLLAEQCAQRDPVLRKESIEEQTGRPANEIVRDLRKALISCGLTRAEAGTIVTTVRSYGYRLGLVGSEVAIEA